MFEVGLVELGVIGLVALLVLGPERLPRAARTVGLYVRKARQSWYSVRADIERELAADELRRSVKRAEQSMRDSAEEIGRGLDVEGPRAASTPASPADPGATRPGHEPPAT
jgi:sec-independent protein translocase protein TatB